MAIKGSLSEASLPDVLQLLAMGQKTGCLSVTDRANFGRIYFERGRITFASIVNRPDRLGDLLVKNGLISQAQLATALKDQTQRPQERLGELLVARGYIDRAILDDYVRIQIEEAVYRLFTWQQGTFYFEAGQRPEPDQPLVSVHPENLLLEGARRVDEWSLIEQRIPSLDLVFVLLRDRLTSNDLDLTDAQRKLIPLVDGRRSVRDLVGESGMVEFDVAKALFGLIQAGLAESTGKKQPRPADPAVGVRIDEHRNLGIAFYRTGMHEEAVREFRRVAELQPKDPSARFYLGLIALRTGDARGGLRRFREAVEIGGSKAISLHNAALALELAGRLDQAAEVLEEARGHAAEHPGILLSKGILAVRRGRPEEAVSAFERYRRCAEADQRPESYFLFLAVAEGARGEMRQAACVVDEGLAAHPRSVRLMLRKAALLAEEGAWDDAEALVERAIEEDGSLAAAHRAMGDLLYRRAEYDGALDAYNRTLELDSEIGDQVHFKLGNIHYKRMDRENAVRCWREALRMNPQHTVARTNLELVERVL